VDKVLSEAWREHQDTADQPQRGAARNTTTLGWFDSLDGFGSLDASRDLVSPRLECMDGQTIRSQAGQSYTQWVPLNDVDSALTICPIGHSDRADSPWRTSTMKLWGEAKFHSAPLSRKAVDKIAADRISLQ